MVNLIDHSMLKWIFIVQLYHLSLSLFLSLSLSLSLSFPPSLPPPLSSRLMESIHTPTQKHTHTHTHTCLADACTPFAFLNNWQNIISKIFSWSRNIKYDWPLSYSTAVQTSNTNLHLLILVPKKTHLGTNWQEHQLVGIIVCAHIRLTPQWVRLQHMSQPSIRLQFKDQVFITAEFYYT